jgi:hypothetical protein
MSPKAPRKRAVVQAKRPADDYTCHPGAASPTVLGKVVESVRGAGTFTTGDQIPPAAILWPDPARLWEPTLKML